MQFTPLLTLCLALATMATAQVTLGTAAPFAVLAASAITNTGNSVLTGEMGIHPDGSSSITGFPPGTSGTIHGGDATAQAAQHDATTAYSKLAALTPTTVLTGQDLGEMTLAAGVYSFASSAQLTGTLTLDGKNNASGVFVFQMGSILTTATGASVVLANGAQACNVFWQLGSSATLGTSTKFAGTVFAEASATANSGVACQGGLFALTAAVTLIDDAITAPGTCSVLPSSSSTTVVAPPTSTSAPPTGTVTITSTKTITDTVTDTITGTVTRTATLTSTDVTTTTDYKTTTATTTVSKTATVTASCTNSKVARYVM